MKQADVVLLGFPLMHPMSSEVRRNDLEMYEPVTELHGPAMTWVSGGAKPQRGFVCEVVVSVRASRCQPRQRARLVRPAVSSAGRRARDAR